MEELSGFGDLLRQERERLGLSIEQATEATRVRGQILAAFENGDFENMPPRGYSQNMIGSYAKFLGLDPREIVARYNDEIDRYESGGASGPSGMSGSGRDSASRSGRHPVSSTGRVKRYERPSQQRSSGDSRQGYGQRQSYLSTTVYSSDDSYSQKSAYGNASADDAGAGYGDGAAEQDAQQDDSRYARSAYGSRRDADTGRRNTSLPDYDTYGADESINGVRNQSERHLRSARIGYTGSDDGYPSRGNRIFSDRGNFNRGGGAISPKSIAIIVGIIAVIIILIVIIRLVACSGSANTHGSNASGTSVSVNQGATATSTTQTGSTTVASTQTVPFTVTITLAEGAESNLHVIVDGVDESYAPAVGPFTKTYNVAQSIEIYVYNPDSVVVSKDGETVEVPWGTDANGASCGVLTITAQTQTTGSAVTTTGSVTDTPAA